MSPAQDDPVQKDPVENDPVENDPVENDPAALVEGAEHPVAISSALHLDAKPLSHDSAGLTRGLLANLLCGLRLAFFRRIGPDQLSVSVEQLIALAVIDLLLALTLDFSAVGLAGRFNPWGLPATFFYLPLTLLAGYLGARLAGQPQLALALPIALLSARQYVSLAVIGLYCAGSALDLSHRTAYWGYYSGPLVWWAAMASFTMLVLVPGRLLTKLAAVALTGILVLVPTWLLPRESMGSLWVAAEDDPGVRERYDALASEDAFYAQPELLRRALRGIAPGTRDRSHLYFVGVAGYADEDVFQKELDVISKLMQERFGTAGRSISLINNPATALSIPLASRTSLARTLERIGQVMNRDQDVLFLYLTSHGSEDHQLAFSFWPLHLRDLDPEGLRKMLDAAHIRWRIVVVSACYSGGFIDPLKTESTLVITAADAQHTSFGCGSESDFTYFGKAYFDQALRKHVSFTAAFEDARRIIEARERGEGKPPSNPQIYVGPAMQQKLHALEAQLVKNMKE
jgi:hypothetical protein